MHEWHCQYHPERVVAEAHVIWGRIGHDVGTVHLHEIGFKPETGFTGTGATNYQHIFIPCRFRVFRAAAHGQAFGFGQNHIVLEYRVNVGRDVLMGAP